VTLKVDFVTGAVAHRRKYGGGKSQLIAKAVGIKAKIFPSILDLTGGLGKDAFVLASLGCTVTLVERNATVFQALHKGIERGIEMAVREDAELRAILQRMILIHADSLDYLQQYKSIEQQVIYLDPMFPERKKSAAVKKEMVLLQEIVGDDADSDALFIEACAADVYRVVVKRPKLAAPLAGSKPPLIFRGTSSRFDVYPKRTLY